MNGQPSLVSEQRQRLTGLGKAHEDPALGVLVGESVQHVPVLPQKGAEGAKTENLVTRSVTYRHRETGLVTVITTDPKGLVTVQRTEGGLLASVETARRRGQGTNSVFYKIPRQDNVSPCHVKSASSTGTGSGNEFRI